MGDPRIPVGEGGDRGVWESLGGGPAHGSAVTAGLRSRSSVLLALGLRQAPPAPGCCVSGCWPGIVPAHTPHACRGPGLGVRSQVKVCKVGAQQAWPDPHSHVTTPILCTET